MIYILRNKQVYLIMLLTIVVAIFLSSSVKNNFIDLYLGNLSNISIRYFFIIISVAIEYFINKLLNNSSIISRCNSKQMFLRKNLKFEVLLSSFIFILFNLIVLIICLPISANYLMYICNTTINIFVIYFTISLIVKIIDCFINVHHISSAIFIFLYVSLDFILDHFNFFFFNNKLFDLGVIYKLYYMYENSIIYFIIILIFDFTMFKILNEKVKRKDFLIKNDEETE